MTSVDEHVQNETADDKSFVAAVKVRAGVDIGNAMTAAIVVDRDTGKAFTPVLFPSIKSARGASLKRALNGRKKLDASEHVLSWKRDGESTDVYVGRLAEKATSALDARSGRERYSNGWTCDFLLTALCAACPHAATIDAEIVTGVPTEFYTPAMEAAVIKCLKKTYSFHYCGRDVSVRISSVQVCEEGYGAWLALPEADREGRTLIIDGGGGTINLVDVHNGVIKNRKTLSDMGVEFVLDDVSQHLVEAGGRKLTLEERRQLLDALRDKQEDGFKIVVNNQPRNVGKLARHLMDDAATALVQILDSKVPLGVYDRIRFVGGAARDGLWGTQVTTQKPIIKVPSADPENENARGYAGVRRGGKR